MHYTANYGVDRLAAVRRIPLPKYLLVALATLLAIAWGVLLWYAASHHLRHAANSPAASAHHGQSVAEQSSTAAAQPNHDAGSGVTTNAAAKPVNQGGGGSGLLGSTPTRNGASASAPSVATPIAGGYGGGGPTDQPPAIPGVTTPYTISVPPTSAQVDGKPLFSNSGTGLTLN